jgi:hypothetical protein
MPSADITAAPKAAGSTARPRRRRRVLAAVVAAILSVVAGYAIWTNTSAYTLQASIQIRATPRQVWAIVRDLRAYHRWNPFIISSTGDLRVGAVLTNVMHDATGNTTFTPTVQVVAPDRELRWLGRVGPGGIFDGQHTLTIRQLGPDLVLFTQREDFTGIAVPFYEGHLRADTLPQFRAMNAALARAASR